MTGVPVPVPVPALLDRSAQPTTTGATGARAAFLGGGRAMLPWLAGVVPFGLTIGVTIAASSLDPVTGWLTAPLIYAGSAQLLAIELLDEGAAPLVVIGTVLAVNARLVAYSGAMAPRWHGTRRAFRGLAAYLLIDPSYAVGDDGYRRHPDRQHGHAHYLGCAIVLWMAWMVAVAAGIVAGGAVPDASLLGLVVPMYLIAEVVRTVATRPALVAAAAGALTGIVGSSLPFHAGAAVAIAAGVAAAVAVERRAS
jgi:predicted branched-subunit amino acid permease